MSTRQKILTVLGGGVLGVLLSTGGVFAQTGWIDDGTVVRLETSTDVVGIGTNSPAATLHIQRSAPNTDGKVTIEGTGDVNAAGLVLKDYDTSKLWDITIRSGSNDDLWFSGYNGSGWNTAMVIKQTSGDVGLGISNPGDGLHVFRNSPNTNGGVTIEGTGDVNAAGLVLKDYDTSKLWDITIRSGSNDDLWFSGYNGSAWNTAMVIKQTSGDVNIAGTITAKGKDLNNASIQRPTHIIYKDDADGYYKSVRTSDGVITHSHPSDAAAVINGLLSSLGSALYYSPLAPNPNYREGREIKIKEGVYNVAQTIVIPPNQDFIFDANRTLINDQILGGGDVVRIDSSMNSYFRFGLITINSDNSVALRIKPQTQGPDDLVVWTSSELIINAVVGRGTGLVVDPIVAAVDLSRFEIVEVNLNGGAGSKIGIDILGGNSVSRNEFRIVGNRVSIWGLRINNNATDNHFTGDLRDINGLGQKSLFHSESITTLTINSGNSGNIVEAPQITTINDGAAGNTNRLIRSGGDLYR